MRRDVTPSRDALRTRASWIQTEHVLPVPDISSVVDIACSSMSPRASFAVFGGRCRDGFAVQRVFFRPTPSRPPRPTGRGGITLSPRASRYARMCAAMISTSYTRVVSTMRLGPGARRWPPIRVFF